MEATTTDLTTKGVIRTFLETEAAFLRSMHGDDGPQQLNGYFSLGEFILKHGVAFDPAKNLSCPRPGPLKECFRNAALLSLEKPKYIYVEGYAMNAFPVMHAWCATPEGEIVEATWRQMGSEYIGIPFKRSYVQRCLAQYRVYGLINQWEHGFPLLKEEPDDFIHPKFKPALKS